MSIVRRKTVLLACYNLVPCLPAFVSILFLVMCVVMEHTLKQLLLTLSRGPAVTQVRTTTLDHLPLRYVLCLARSHNFFFFLYYACVSLLACPPPFFFQVHAKIEYDEEERTFFVTDYGSRNGTFINDERLSEVCVQFFWLVFLCVCIFSNFPPFSQAYLWTIGRN